MDIGHHNCRDYHVLPAAVVNANELRLPLIRHESYSELERRARSPASFQPKFPLLRLPLELRQQIYSYLIPRTQDPAGQSSALGSQSRSTSTEQKRGGGGLALRLSTESGRDEQDRSGRPAATSVIWVRGCTSLLAVCKQMHAEAAAMMYGQSTFLLFITYSDITFLYKFMLPSGMAPIRSYKFLNHLSTKYIQLIRKVIVHIDHVDSYTAMHKFNTSGAGLIHRLREQVQSLVLALQPSSDRMPAENLSRVIIRVSSPNAVLETIKTRLAGTRDVQNSKSQRKTSPPEADGVRTVLEPFQDLAAVRDVSITGAVSRDFAEKLENVMRKTEPQIRHRYCREPDLSRLEADRVPLCVYGNDID